MRILVGASALSLSLANLAGAADIGVAATKLRVLVKTGSVSKAKVSYLAKDTTAGITKGTGNDLSQINARLDIAYVGENGSAAGAFIVPPGISDGTAGWSTSAMIVKYTNRLSPGGPTNVKKTMISPGKSLALLAKGAGDVPIDILASGSPLSASVVTAYCVANAGEFHCHCSRFTACTYKVSNAGTVGKLQCLAGVPDAGCTAAPAAICGNGGLETGETCDGPYFPDTAPGGHGPCRESDGAPCTFCGDGVIQLAAGEQCDDANDQVTDACAGCIERVCGDDDNFGPCPSGQECIRDYTNNSWACLSDDPICNTFDLSVMCSCVSSFPAGIMDLSTCSATCHNGNCFHWCCPPSCAGTCALCSSDTFTCLSGSCPSGTICVPSGVPWG